MSNVTVCCRFRPLSSKEMKESCNTVCIQEIDAETFIFKDERDEESTFSFDRVFYEESHQAHVYEFLALPIVRDAANGKNGTIITYGQTGAGKTFSVEGPNLLECDDLKKGLLARVVDGLFEGIKSADGSTAHTLKLSMVEIYMEKVRDLLDLTKDNVTIKESKTQGIMLSGVTAISILDPASALQTLSRGIVNRAVGETQMNMASSRSHCVYIFTVQQENPKDKRGNVGKIILVDLAGSEKVEKTGAEGKVLEEAKTINKSLSALGNVINALTSTLSAKTSHVPYRDSKLTRILQDCLDGNSKLALLCCCSPSPSNASETLSTLRFGTRAKHIKALPIVICKEDKYFKKHGAVDLSTNDLHKAILIKMMRERANDDDVKLIEEAFVPGRILSDPSADKETESAYEDVISQTIYGLQRVVEALAFTIQELKIENESLKARLEVAEKLGGNTSIFQNFKDMVQYLTPL